MEREGAQHCMSPIEEIVDLDYLLGNLADAKENRGDCYCNENFVRFEELDNVLSFQV